MSLKVIDGPTILAGQSLSDGIDCTGSNRVLRVIFPSDWTAAPLSFLLSPDGVTYSDLYNASVPSFAIYPVSVSGLHGGSTVVFPAATGVSLAWLKIRSGTFAAPVNQAADRSFKIVLDMPDAAADGGTGAQGPAGPAGPIGPQGPQGAPGQTVMIIGSFTNRAIADLPPSGYIPKDWDSPGNPPLGNQMANGQGLLHTPTQEVCLWVGPTLTPAGWVVLGDVQGPPGPVGPQGAVGAQGSAGPAGPVGVQGSTGAQGLPGVAGATGAVGPVGATGAAGTPGATGPTGTYNLKGTIVADNAAAGIVGEVLQVSTTTAVACGANTTIDIATLALTPGDWAVSGVVVFSPVSTAPSALAASITLTSVTLPTAAQIAAGTGNMTQYRMSFTNGQSQTMQTGISRINISAPQNVYLDAQATFSGGSVTAIGYMSARRVR